MQKLASVATLATEMVYTLGKNVENLRVLCIINYKSLTMHSYSSNRRKTIIFYTIMFLWLKRDLTPKLRIKSRCGRNIIIHVKFNMINHRRKKLHLNQNSFSRCVIIFFIIVLFIRFFTLGQYRLFKFQNI